METMGNLRRTHYSVALNEANVGEEVTVAGYVAKVRDLGAVVFCDVRDTKGVVQLNFGDDSSAELLEKAKMLRTEFVVMAKGEVVLREKANPNIPTGKIEIKVGELKILSKAETTPFEIKDDIIMKVVYTRGCEGNAKGIGALIKGMSVEEAIRRLEGITCGKRGTSCPDQLSKVLKSLK